MHFLTTSLLLAASGALALPRHECLPQNSGTLADLSSCGDPVGLKLCLSGLEAFSHGDVKACYVGAGCSPEEAAREASLALDGCDEASRADGGDLRRRGAFEDRLAPTTAAADLADLLAAQQTLFPRAESDDPSSCYSTSTVETSTCSSITQDGKHTTECAPTQAAESECMPGKTCTVDTSGGKVCMDLQNDLDLAGIIIAIVFAIAIVLGIGYLAYMCWRDGRDQKRLAAKAEASALARAHTKKMRAQESRAPLMRQHSGQQGGPDPFADGNRS